MGYGFLTAYVGDNRHFLRLRYDSVGRRDLEDLPIEVAVGRFSVVLVVILVVLLGGPELPCGGDLRFHVKTLVFQGMNQAGGDFLLLLIQIEDGGSVLLTDVRPLAVQLREVMSLEKQPGQLLVARFRGIVNHFDRFGVACLVRADLFVGRIVNVPARVTDGCG